MNEIIQTTSSVPSVAIPLPVRSEVTIRPAVASDVTFVDKLQRVHSDRVGWMPTKVLERKIELREIIIAEVGSSQLAVGREDGDLLPTANCQLPTPIGYCMGQDRYFKRDDVGIIYQMNILPGNQRGLVGATLLKAQFEKSAYGCKLYCCWCAQDIEANRFWEAMGFVPLAFRAGSRGKGRVHIFWQRRIRSGDETTPYWFPSQTGAGAMKEDRIVLPIPPATHWSEVRPTVLPEEKFAVGSGQLAENKKRERKAKAPAPKVEWTGLGRMSFAAPVVACPEQGRGEKPKVEKVKEPKKKVKNDPKLVAAARELRDRWLEQVNAPGGDRLLVSNGKYDVSRPAQSGVEGMLGDANSVVQPEVKQITAMAA